MCFFISIISKVVVLPVLPYRSNTETQLNMKVSMLQHAQCIYYISNQTDTTIIKELILDLSVELSVYLVCHNTGNFQGVKTQYLRLHFQYKVNIMWVKINVTILV